MTAPGGKNSIKTRSTFDLTRPNSKKFRKTYFKIFRVNF